MSHWKFKKNYESFDMSHWKLKIMDHLTCHTENLKIIDHLSCHTEKFKNVGSF